MNGWLLATAGGWTNAMNAECLVNIGVRIIISFILLHYTFISWCRWLTVEEWLNSKNMCFQWKLIISNWLFRNYFGIHKIGTQQRITWTTFRWRKLQIWCGRLVIFIWSATTILLSVSLKWNVFIVDGKWSMAKYRHGKHLPTNQRPRGFFQTKFKINEVYYLQLFINATTKSNISHLRRSVQ